MISHKRTMTKQFVLSCLLTLNLYLYITYAPKAAIANTIKSTHAAAHVAFASLAFLPAHDSSKSIYDMVHLRWLHGQSNLESHLCKYLVLWCIEGPHCRCTHNFPTYLCSCIQGTDKLFSSRIHWYLSQEKKIITFAETDLIIRHMCGSSRLGLTKLLFFKVKTYCLAQTPPKKIATNLLLCNFTCMKEQPSILTFTHFDTITFKS